MGVETSETFAIKMVNCVAYLFSRSKGNHGLQWAYMENHEYQLQEVYVYVLGHVMNEFELFADQSTWEDNTSTSVPHFVNSCRPPAGWGRGPCWSPGQLPALLLLGGPLCPPQTSLGVQPKLTDGLQQPGNVGREEAWGCLEKDKTSNLVTLILHL